MRPLQEFLDTKLFGAAFTGVAAMATSYVAGGTGWSLIIVPLVVIAVYQLCFSAAPTGRYAIPLGLQPLVPPAAIPERDRKPLLGIRV